MKIKKFLLATISLLLASAQTYAQGNGAKVSFGIAGGAHISSLKFSDAGVNNNYPKKNSLTSGLFSVFAEIDFLKNGQLGIRPQFSFLNRGGTLHANLPSTSIYDDVSYSLKSHYVDFRIPIMYQFCTYKSVVRPYIFVAPVFGFSTGGKINYEYSPVIDYEVDITKANMSGINLAAQFGAGIKFGIPVASSKMYVGMEFAYELGLTDTYGSKEKDHKAINILGKSYNINGTRKLNGFEISAVLTVPFDIFKKKAVSRPVEPQPVEVKPQRKPCYSLDEIQSMLAAGQSVRGKKICAISDINFDYGKSNIKRNSYKYLDKLASVLIGLNKDVVISGHTDNSGSAEYNNTLSKQRAAAVANYLIKKGLDPSLITTEGYGFSQPISTNNTEQGRALNRRVEIDIK